MSFLKNVLLFIDYVLYEITYYFLGAGAIFDDIISRKTNRCPLRDLDGATAIVTGGARGIGASLVKKLLQCNMNVIIGCRDVSAGRRKIEDIRNMGITGGDAIVYELDLMSFSSIKKFADEVKNKNDQLYLLVNNAGIMFAPYKETEDGFESHWGVNYLGPALLSHLLLPLLSNSSDNSHGFPPRIVNVTSCAHVAARRFDFKDLSMKNRYIPSAAYAQSKLAQILFSIELSRRLHLAGSRVSVHCVHPGIVNTDLFDGTLLKKTMPWVLTHFCKDADMGATSVLYACISPELDVESGSYSTNCRFEAPGRNALSAPLQKRIFELTLKSLNISKFGNLDI